MTVVTPDTVAGSAGQSELPQTKASKVWHTVVASKRPIIWTLVFVGLAVAWWIFQAQLAYVRIWVAVLPGAFIVHQALFLGVSRRHQFEASLGPNAFSNAKVMTLAHGYFGGRALTIRYLIPAVLATVLCWFALDVLASPPGTAPQGLPLRPATAVAGAPSAAAAKAAVTTSPAAETQPTADAANAKQATDAGQTEPTSSPGGDKSAAAPAQDQAAQPAGESKAPTPTALAGSPPQDTSAFQWLLGSKSDGSELILRGARFGFAGAYLYTLILLAQRGFRRDLTSGVAMWAAALFVLGPLAGALAALLVSGVVAGSPEGGFVRDAVFVFAGMLPREFSGYLQSSARRMLQPGATALALRTMPISMLRGATAAIEERLAEEGIEDVGSLAYASPFQLIRATSFDARQIVQWIDEALLISTVPEGWQELEKAGITGAIDLAWCHEHDASVTKLAGVTKIDEDLLKAIIQRLDEDAQVADLRCFYWSKEDEKATSDGASSRDRAAAKNQASPANQPTPSDDAGPGDEAAPKKAGPMISVRFETVAGVTPDAQDEIARAVAPDAEVSKNGPVVTLSNVDAKDQEKVRAMLGAEQRVAPDSFQVV